MSGEYTRPSMDGNGTTTAPNGSAPESPLITSASTVAPTSATAGKSDGIPKPVEDVIYSDIGVATLLNRLKQSIASARDFAAFLKKRSSLEEEQATGLKRLARSQLETLRRAEVRTGSYAAQLAEVMKVHERMADNGMQFALSLHQMHEDLNELSANMERGRKQWKHEGLDAEKRASDAEAAMHKAKTKYDGLAEDYDRARTGDTKGSKRIGLKGPKSAEQYEQDLQRKTQAADAEYEERVKLAKSQRERLLSNERPKAVKSLQELIKESDSALTLQLQKFATFNEKLLLGNGLAVTPLTDKDVAGSQRSMRDVIYEIDNETDFHSYMRGHASKIPARPSEIKYEQHPTLLPKTQKPSDQQPAASSTFSHTGGRQISGPTGPPLSLNTRTPQGPTANSNSREYSTPQGNSSASYDQPPPTSSAGGYSSQPLSTNQQMQSPTAYGGGGAPQIPQQSYNTPYSAADYSAAPAPPYPTHQSSSDRLVGPGSYNQQTTGTLPPASRQYTGNNHQYNTSTTTTSSAGGGGNPTAPLNTTTTTLPPLRPVFGVPLDDLFDRDATAVPMVVIQCILAIDTFGLDVEGIYRLSGTASHITTLKSHFDHNAAQIDFRNPANFFHDVNSVATLLKQFFRDLPDPLFTKQGYGRFIEAARMEDEGQRRDALHQTINDLPDANYATLRHLVLHLARVMGNEGRNRMGGSNLALCFAPSLMGTHTGAQIADASLQARVVDTILGNALAIFEED